MLRLTGLLKAPKLEWTGWVWNW